MPQRVVYAHLQIQILGAPQRDARVRLKGASAALLKPLCWRQRGFLEARCAVTTLPEAQD